MSWCFWKVYWYVLKISCIAKRYSKANNKYMEDFELTKLSKYTSCLDMNNLYGWAMSGCLPNGRFKKLKNVDNFDANSVSEKTPIWYILNVDLKYSDELHVLHNDYPLAPEKLDEIKVGNVEKLIPNLGNKTNYVVHYKNIQLFLSLGMKLTKIHRVLRFKQSDWMKEYIDFNEYC